MQSNTSITAQNTDQSDITEVNPGYVVASEDEVDESDYDMMCGIGLDKTSNAVYFVYQGDKQAPLPLVKAQSKRPKTRWQNVTLEAIRFRDNIGEFKSTKLNVLIKSQQTGKKYLLTSGIDSLWTKNLITSLVGLFRVHQVSTSFNLDTWRGTSAMKPCFCGIRVADIKYMDEQLRDQLSDAYSDRDDDRREKLLRDAVMGIQMLLKGNAPIEVAAQTVSEEQALPETQPHSVDPETLPDDCPF